MSIWTAIMMIGTAIGGVVIFLLNLRKIRELNLKISKLEGEASEKASRIYRPTTQEVERYAVRPNDLERLRLKKLRRASFLNILLFLITILAIFYTQLIPVTPPPVTGPELEIETPHSGDLVYSSEIVVVGRTRLKDKEIYLLARPEGSRDYWVQGPASVSLDGRWVGHVWLGRTDAGKVLAIRAIATNSKLETGRLEELPKGTIVTPEVVLRIGL